MRRAAIAVAALVLGCAPTVTAPPTVAPTASFIPAASEGPAGSSPPIDVRCTPDSEAPAALGDPCGEAIVAVELAVAPVRLPIRRVVIEPGPFYCNNVWPGAGSEAPCYGPIIRPGQYMHAWVSFERSDKIAAVMLGRDFRTEPGARDFPTEPGSPEPTVGPWSATLVTVEVPPAAWVMP